MSFRSEDATEYRPDRDSMLSGYAFDRINYANTYSAAETKTRYRYTTGHLHLLSAD